MSDFLWPHGLHGRILQARILERVAFPFSTRSSQARIEPRSPALQADSLPAEPQEKLRNTGVGNLALLQRIFLTQELSWGLLHCRRILYHLSYQGSPSLDIRPFLIRYMIWYSLILGLSLNFLDNIFGTQVFNLMKSIISIFFLLLLVPLMSYLKIYCLIQSCEDLLQILRVLAVKSIIILV